jgi:hypothetical protein
MDYEYQGKKEEIHKLIYIIFEINILSIDFIKYFLAVNTNSGAIHNAVLAQFLKDNRTRILKMM